MNGKHKQWLQCAVFIVFNTLFYYLAAKEKQKEQTINKIKKSTRHCPQVQVHSYKMCTALCKI